MVSNWPDLEEEVARFGVPYHHVPVTGDTKPAAEARQLELVGGGRYDLVVLARYMQILSPGFLDRIGCPVINIHHSFLPAFAGANPYMRAKAAGGEADRGHGSLRDRGSRRGPDHRAGRDPGHARGKRRGAGELGADIERTVLQRAVTWHCQDRVLVDGATTVVL